MSSIRIVDWPWWPIALIATPILVMAGCVFVVTDGVREQRRLDELCAAKNAVRIELGGQRLCLTEDGKLVRP